MNSAGTETHESASVTADADARLISVSEPGPAKNGARRVDATPVAIVSRASDLEQYQ